MGRVLLSPRTQVTQQPQTVQQPTQQPAQPPGASLSGVLGGLTGIQQDRATMPGAQPNQIINNLVQSMQGQKTEPNINVVDKVQYPVPSDPFASKPGQKGAPLTLMGQTHGGAKAEHLRNLYEKWKLQEMVKAEGKRYEKRLNVTEVGKNIDTLLGRFAKVKPYKKGLSTIAGGIWEKGKEQTKYGEDLQAYNNQLEGMLGPIARQLFAEKGVMTDRDIERARSFFPSVWDSENVRAMKIYTLSHLMSNATGANWEGVYTKHMPVEAETQKTLGPKDKEMLNNAITLLGSNDPSKLKQAFRIFKKLEVFTVGEAEKILNSSGSKLSEEYVKKYFKGKNPNVQ